MVISNTTSKFENYATNTKLKDCTLSLYHSAYIIHSLYFLSNAALKRHVSHCLAVGYFPLKI